MKNYLSPSSVLRQAHVGFYALLLFFLIGVGNAYAQSSVVPQGGLAFYKADFELNENQGTVTFSYGFLDSSATCGEQNGCRVTLTSRDGTARAGVDYGAFQITLSWNFGEGGFKPFSIRIIDNTLVDGTRTFFVDVTNAVGIDPTSSFFSIDILDDDVAVCPAVFDPVCGADGETYNNSCEAEVAGVEVVHEGACSDIPPSVLIISPAQNPVRLTLGQSVSFASKATSDNPNFDPSFSWSFPGGTPSSSTLENPGSVQFISAGTHTVRVSVTDQSNGKSATDIITVVVEEAVIGGMVDPTDDSRGALDLGVLTPSSEPVIKGLSIENSSAESLEVNTLNVVGKGFGFPVLSTANQRFTKADIALSRDGCEGRKSGLVKSTLSSGQSCVVDIVFDPTGLPAGLHAGLLKIETTVGQKTVELLARVDGPQTFFDGGRALNISTNGFVDQEGMVAGFIVTGTAARRFVLMGENMQGLSDPELMLTDFTAETVYAENDNWQDHATAAEIVSELRAPGAAQDAAFAITLEPGIYLAWLTGKAGQTGRGLVSITDISAPPGDDATRLLNISTGSPVSTTAMVAGFIVSGLESADFVIMGERLNSALNPRLRLTDINGVTEFASNDSWQNHPTAATVQALDRAPRSTVDAAFAVTLPPGVYLAWLESEDGQSFGQGLISITEVQGP